VYSMGIRFMLFCNTTTI